jgi:ABC-type multidrug transport system fused ATPase/permease subunit
MSRAVRVTARHHPMGRAGPTGTLTGVKDIRSKRPQADAMKRSRWWMPPRDTLSRSLARHGMPATLAGFVRRVSAPNQLRMALLASIVFVLNTAPLEMQRRILNAAILERDAGLVVLLGLIYAAIVVSEGVVKLLMNVYGGWVAEKAVRVLRLAASKLAEAIPAQRHDARIQGVEISLILAEPEAIGGFVGIALSELVLQVGILVSVFAYMFFVHPLLALVCLAIFSPQFVFVPLMQAAINRRVQSRIAVLRQASVGVLLAAHDAGDQRSRFADIFELNLGIVKLRFSMKFLMNFTHNAGKVIMLCVGGWYVIRGETDVGTVVAFVSGLGNIRDPWSDLVNWYQDMMLTTAKYRTFVGAMEQFAAVEALPAAAHA